MTGRCGVSPVYRLKARPGYHRPIARPESFFAPEGRAMMAELIVLEVFSDYV